MAFVCRFAELHVTYTCIFQDLLYSFLVLVAHLDNDTRVFCKQNLDKVLLLDFIQVDFHTALHIGKAHFKQCSDKATGRNIMSGKNQSLVDQLLHGKESIAEVFGILHAGNFVTHFAQGLGEGGTTEFQVVETEVYMINGSFFIVDQHWRNDLLDIGNFSTGRNNYRARRNDFAAVGVFLCHGKRVFTSRYIDLQGAAEVTQCLYCRVQTGIFTFLRTARPHPVGRKGNAVQTFGKRCPNQVGQGFADGKNGAGCRVGKCRLGSMAQRGCDTLFAAIVQSYHTTIAQRQLQFTLALLAGNLACYRTVHLVCQPVFTSHSFQLEHIGEVFM